jgi:hypothetical protein
MNRLTRAGALGLALFAACTPKDIALASCESIMR